MDWEELVDYSHTWSDDVFRFVVAHLRGQPTADDLIESFSNNDQQRHHAILQAAETAGTTLGAAELAELSDYTTGALKEDLVKRAAASTSTF